MGPKVGAELHLDDIDLDETIVELVDRDLSRDGSLVLVAAQPLAEWHSFFLEGCDELCEAFVAGVFGGRGAELPLIGVPARLCNKANVVNQSPRLVEVAVVIGITPKRALVPRRAIDALAQEVRVPAVTGVLFDHVNVDPAQVHVATASLERGHLV